MLTLEKISTLEDMNSLMRELRRMEAKNAFDFLGALQDFASKKFLPQWFQKKGIKNYFISESGSEIILKINSSKKNSVVIFDLETPDLNGLQFLASLEKNPDLKAKCKVILVIPATIPPDARNQLLGRGANSLVSKPIADDALQAAFKEIGLGY
ncbi:MAG: response regulator [Fibromonadaceae bacterium]|jgi:CheY-like chemotaxis protein|nr:response regulator [Fibromonadaceae bacterium]